MFKYQIIPSNVCEQSKAGPSATPKTFKNVSSFGSSQEFILTPKQYSLTAFLSFKKDVLTIFSVAL